MTAEKHPLEIVRDQLKAVLCDPQGVCCISGSDADRGIVDNALTTLNHYLCQTQSCSECERLGRENEDLRLEVRDFGAVYGGVDDWGDKLAEVQEKHAATIAAAGGE